MNNQTPMAAVKTPLGREKVNALLLDIAQSNFARIPGMEDAGEKILQQIRTKLNLDKNAPDETVDEKMRARLEAVNKQLCEFCTCYELTDFQKIMLDLCDEVAVSRTLNFDRGKPEIWAAAIAMVIIRLNFLFYDDGPVCISKKDVCNFFNTKSSTTGAKAGLIQDALDIFTGDQMYTHPAVKREISFQWEEDRNGLVSIRFGDQKKMLLEDDPKEKPSKPVTEPKPKISDADDPRQLRLFDDDF
ncbi:DUF6398 domain-containing protein [Desulfobacterales bacterium HSG17]|nr:DUF6398 domain-containing protein [Desulfobacterales bacterium HSG17]